MASGGLAAAALALGAVSAQAADFPTRPKRLTTPASGTSDTYFDVVGTTGGFVAAWNRANSTTFQTTIMIQRFTPDGSPVGRPATVDGPAFLEGLPQLADLGGGKIGVVWKGPGPSGGPAIKGAIYDAASDKVGAPSPLLASGAASFMHDVARMKNGKVAIVTRQSPAFGVESTMLLMADASMKPSGAPRVVEDDKPAPFGAATFEQTVVANGDGGVALYRANDNQLKGVAFDGAGKLGKPFQINTTSMTELDLFGYARFTVKAAPLPNGGYVAAWLIYDAGQRLSWNVHARVFDKTGKPVGKDFIVHRDTSGDQTYPEIAVFDKGFGIVWHNVAVVGAITTQRVRFFDLAGAPLSDDLVTERFGLDGPSGILVPGVDSEIAKLPNGDFIRAFGSGGSLLGDRIPAPRLGAPGDDTLAGKASSETLLARGGIDTVTGGGGDDTVDGGENGDTIDGGDGADEVVAGGGDDTLTGGAGPDVFVFRPKGGKDTVLDFQNADRIDVSAFHYNRKDDVLAAAAQSGKDLVITLVDQTDAAKSSAIVRLKNVKKDKFTAANIIQ